MDLAFLNRVIPRKPSANPLGLRGSYADPIRNIDWILLTAVIAQVIIGLFTVFSATRQRLIDQNLDVFVFVQRQVFFVIVAAAVMTIVMSLGHDWLRAQSGFLYGAVLLLLIMVLGFFIDFVEISYIIVPILAPIAANLGINPVWYAILVAMNLQTSFLTPPFGFSLFYLKGVAPPEVRTMDIYYGVVPFIILQAIVLGILVIYPEWFGFAAH